MRLQMTKRHVRTLGAVVLVLLALCAFTAGVLAKYVSATADKTVSVTAINQWSSAEVGERLFPVDVYVRAYVTTGKIADNAAQGMVIIDGTATMGIPTSADTSSWQTLSSDPYCFYYVGDDGIVTGGEQVPTLSLVDGESYKIVYEYLEAGRTDGGKLTCQAAWGVTIGKGSVIPYSAS